MSGWNWGGALGGAGTGATMGSAIHPLWGTLIGGLAGGVAGGFGSPTEKVGGPGDITQVNPYTDSFYNKMAGYGDNTYNMLMSGMGGGNQFYGQMQDAIAGLDPNAAYNYYMNNNVGGQMRGQAEDNFAQFNTANQQVADRFSNQAVQNISSQFANRGPGALRSGGAMHAISEGAINPLLQSNAAIGQMIGGQAGQMQGQAMQNLFGSHTAADQMQLAGLSGLMGSADNRMMADQNTLAGLMGMFTGQQGSIANPWLHQQQWMNSPNFVSAGQGINSLASLFGPNIGPTPNKSGQKGG